MSCRKMSFRRGQRSTSVSNLILASAAAMLAVAVTAATPGALAAAPFPGAGEATASSGNAMSTGSADRTPARPLVVIQAALRAGAPALALTPGHLVTLPARPQDAGSELFIAGGVHATWGANSEADLSADAIENLRSSGTSGDLQLTLWATIGVPVTSQGINGYELAAADLGSLPAGDEFSSVDTGEISYVAPNTNGCYYVSLVLLENNLVADIRTFAGPGTKGSPQTTGFAHFPFPASATCPLATHCTRTATSACLVGSRFQVTSSYDNTTTGSGAGSVLNFGSTRAESDESVFFYFTDPSNFEMGAKILDACSFSSSFWVFIGGLTNQGWDLNIVDTATGNRKTYSNVDGTVTVTVTDTAALPCP